RGVVVIEAAARSGALITASHAAEQGRPVFAVPGPLDSPASAGVHDLLRKGAILVRGVDDILEELEGVRPATKSAKTEPPPALDETEMRIWTILKDRPRHLDEMTQELGLPVQKLAGALLLMEMKKLVKRLPGNQYERC